MERGINNSAIDAFQGGTMVNIRNGRNMYSTIFVGKNNLDNQFQVFLKGNARDRILDHLG